MTSHASAGGFAMPCAKRKDPPPPRPGEIAECIQGKCPKPDECDSVCECAAWFDQYGGTLCAS